MSTAKRLAAALTVLVVLVASHALQMIGASAADRSAPPPVAQMPLSPREKMALASGLQQAPPGVVAHVACAGAWCTALANDLAILLDHAKWVVIRDNGGGLGIDGVSGIRVNSCGFQQDVVRDLIESSTKRKVDVISDGPCEAAGADRAIYIVIGRPQS